MRCGIASRSVWLTRAQQDTLFDLGFVDIVSGQWPHRRLMPARREEADRLRPFALRAEGAIAMMPRIIQARCTPPQDASSAPAV